MIMREGELMEPSHPKLELVASYIPEGLDEEMKAAIEELKTALLAFILWPSILISTDQLKLGKGINESERGEWTRTALQDHLNNYHFSTGSRGQSGFKKNMDWDIKGTLCTKAQTLWILIEVDNVRSDQVAKKYISRKVDILNEKLESGVFPLLISVCYPGDSFYDLKDPKGVMEKFEGDLKYTERAIGYFGFLPEMGSAQVHLRFHPKCPKQVSGKFTVEVKVFKVKAHGIGLLKQRAVSLFTGDCDFKASANETYELKSDQITLQREQIKGLLYFPEDFHDLIRDWKSLKPILEKGW
jgi:hypothetical protein